jgi:eukaryotic-like serine/threonine-protein kinase
MNVHLNLPTAILVKPLTRHQIEDYLKRFGTSMDGVQAVLQDDMVLWDLLTAPFMLNIITLAFKNKPPDYIRGTGGPEERRKQIFKAYKDAMFDRPGRSTVKNYNFTQRQTEYWLSWLAKSMGKHNLSIFFLERIQLDWIQYIWQQRAIEVGTLIIAVLVIGLAYKLTIGLAYELTIGLFIGFVVEQLGGMLSRQDKYEAAENVYFSLHDAIDGLRTYGLAFGLVDGLTFGLIGWLTSGSAVGLRLGLASVLVFGMFSGTVAGLKVGYLEKGMNPNEGIYKSLRNALIIGLGVGLASALICVVSSGQIAGVIEGLIIGLIGGVIIGLVFGLSFNLSFESRWANLDSLPVQIGLICGLAGGLLFGLVFGLPGGLASGLTFGLGTGLAFF